MNAPPHRARQRLLTTPDRASKVVRRRLEGLPGAGTVASMADHDDWTAGDVTSMIANPFYAITIDEGLCMPTSR